jgi:arylsulfatase A-like enzyme
MNRLAAIAGASVLAASLSAGGNAPDRRAASGKAAVAAGRPNIVVLMADDLDLGSFEAAGEAGLLPHLSQLFARGTRFRESFVTESLCCPSRATYLTGLYPHNHGVVRLFGTHGGFATFRRRFDDNNLATWMQAAGYHTAFLGKYLNGYANPRVVPRGWNDWRTLLELTQYCMYEYKLSINGRLVRYGSDPVRDYQTDVLAGLAEEVIRASRADGDARPLFLNIAATAPHTENFCNEGRIRPAPRHALTPALPFPRPVSFNEADMSDKPRWMRELPALDEARMERLFNERIVSLRALDDLVGRVVGAIAAQGELDRTAFLFTSDNGFLLGQHRWEGKIVLYEESIRVPLLMRVPGLDGPPVVDAVALNNDLAPTIAALAGATPALPVDGRSLLPLLEGTAASWRKRFLAAFPPVPATLFPDLTPDVPPFWAVRSVADDDLSNLLYAETTTGNGRRVIDRELYDVDPGADPFQVTSRHRDPSYSVRQQRLKQHLEALKSCAGGACQTLEE